MPIENVVPWAKGIGATLSPASVKIKDASDRVRVNCFSEGHSRWGENPVFKSCSSDEDCSSASQPYSPDSSYTKDYHYCVDLWVHRGYQICCNKLRHDINKIDWQDELGQGPTTPTNEISTTQRPVASTKGVITTQLPIAKSVDSYTCFTEAAPGKRNKKFVYRVCATDADCEHAKITAITFGQIINGQHYPLCVRREEGPKTKAGPPICCSKWALYD